MKIFLLPLLLFSQIALAQDGASSMLMLDSPRKTMRSFMSAMQDYKEGVATNDAALKSRIEDALQCLNLSEITPLIRSEAGKEAAIFLKEFIDRSIVIDLQKIPDTNGFGYWRLKGTEVAIAPVKLTENSKHGLYLFTEATVKNAKRFYDSVKDKPYLKGSGDGALYNPPLLEKHLPKWAQDEVLGLQSWQILGIFLALLAGFIIKALVEFVLMILLKISAHKEGSLRFTVLESVEKPLGLAIATGFWFSAIHFLKFEGGTLAFFLLTVKVCLSFSLIWIFYNFTEVAAHFLTRVTNKTESTLDDQLVPLVIRALKVFIVIFGILMTIQNLGFNVMSLMAGLGLGGLAFALAAKDTAANVFGSIMIVIDRPFKIGDWIKADNVEGTVEDIGFRSTRVRTFYKSLITIPNSILATEKIDNMAVRPARRATYNLGVTYQTTPEQMEAFLVGIKNILSSNKYTEKDTYHVTFRTYGDFSLNVFIYFFLKVPDWSQELIQTQNINLEILRLAKELKVEFAYPTQSLFIEQTQLLPKGSPTVDELLVGASSFAPNGQNSKPDGLGIYSK